MLNIFSTAKKQWINYPTMFTATHSIVMIIMFLDVKVVQLCNLIVNVFVV